MSKKAYVGVNGQSHNVKQIYVGVGGVPKKVVKGYVGVNGVPKVFWEGGGHSGMHITATLTISNHSGSQVDFSNASLTMVNKTSAWTVGVLYLDQGANLYNESSSYSPSITTNATKTVLVNTNQRYVINHTGKFTTNGTGFHIGADHNPRVWKVTDVSFSGGDTYSFDLEINLTID